MDEVEEDASNMSSSENGHLAYARRRQERPKSAVRRRTVDRDLDEAIEVVEDEDDLDEEDDDDDDDDDEEDFIEGHQRLTRSQKRPLTTSTTGGGEGSTIATSQQQHMTRAQSATFSSDEGLINNQGVHDLFADILFAGDDDDDLDDEALIDGLEDSADLSMQQEAVELFGEEYEEWRLVQEPQRPFQSAGPPLSASNSRSVVDKRRKRLHRILTSQDGTDGMVAGEAELMERLIARTRGDAESRAKIAGLQEQQQLRPRQFSFGYPELQKASGLRVLRRLVERQQNLEHSDAILVHQIASSGQNDGDFSSSSSKPQQPQELFYRKKPPARLKPLHTLD